MTTVMFEPHHDDIALFAAYTAISLQPDVVTVLGASTVQAPYGVLGLERDQESLQAMLILDVPSWLAWRHSDVNPNWDAIEADMQRYDEAHRPDCAWAPLWESGGHNQHNLISIIAESVFGERVRFYATYKRGNQRTRTSFPVTPPHPDAISQKMRAMACYQSQIRLESTRPWFADDWTCEWVGSLL